MIKITYWDKKYLTVDDFNDILFVSLCLDVITCNEYVFYFLANHELNELKSLNSLTLEGIVNKRFGNFDEFIQNIYMEQEWIREFHLKLLDVFENNWLKTKSTREILHLLEEFRGDFIEYWLDHGKNINLITKYLSLDEQRKDT